MSPPDGLERYDGNCNKHYHFKCKNCGGIFDVDIDYLDGIDDEIRKKYSFIIDEHDIVFKGICIKCGESRK